MAYAPASLRWLADQWEAAVPSAVFSGIVGDAAHTYGYHRAASEIPRTDYSRQLAGDRDADGIDMAAADALDMSMSGADMRLVTGRLYRSWLDPNDPRLNFWREAIGTLDGSTVIYMDCQLAQRGTADNSHLWHVHCGGLRVHANNYDAAKAMLSVVRGETVAQWQGTPAPIPGGGTTVSQPFPFWPVLEQTINGTAVNAERAAQGVAALRSERAAAEVREVARDAAQTELIRGIAAAAGVTLTDEQVDRLAARAATAVASAVTDVRDRVLAELRRQEAEREAALRAALAAETATPQG